MTDPIREVQAYNTAVRRLQKAEEKVVLSVRTRYARRQAELQSKLSGAALRLIEAMEEPESEDD